MNSKQVFLVSYNPIVRFISPQQINKRGLPAFIDYSCRKEPDFLAVYPSISALCRRGKFAPRLHEGDRAVYITTQGQYLGLKLAHWRFVAILKIHKRFETHRIAADWYHQQGAKLPSNCMVKDNPPAPVEDIAPHKKYGTDIHAWDLSYAARARENPVFLACNAEFLELNDPPVVTRETMIEVFGRVPGTQNPPAITVEQFTNLKKMLGIA